MIKFLIGGSPCTHWSIAKSKNRETTAEGIGWELFKNYLIAQDKFKPDFFLYENNKSAAQAIKDQISLQLGQPLQYINSALVSPQNRQRFYVHSFGEVPQPEDRGIILQDILISTTGSKPIPLNMGANGKAQCLRATCYKDGMRNLLFNHVDKRTCVAERIECEGMTVKNAYEVVDGAITYNGEQYKVDLPDGNYIIRKMTVTECCRLQTLPDDYCRVANKTHAYMGLGNGWTAEIIIHLLSYALAGVPKDEEIVVLSMYDGIGTGRYCFDKLGYCNVKYFAYEIDNYAMQIAQSNFSDILQCGDAFQVREDNWKLKHEGIIYDYNARDRYKRAVNA